MNLINVFFTTFFIAEITLHLLSLYLVRETFRPVQTSVLPLEQRITHLESWDTRMVKEESRLVQAPIPYPGHKPSVLTPIKQVSPLEGSLVFALESPDSSIFATVMTDYDTPDYLNKIMAGYLLNNGQNGIALDT